LKLPSAAERQIRTLGSMVAADPTLGRDIPDLNSLVKRVLAVAQTKPFEVPIAGKGSNKTAQVTLGRFDLEQLVIGMLGDRSGLQRLPRMLLDFERRRLSSTLVREAVSEIIALRTGPIGSAMSYATDCASLASPERLERIGRETESGMLGHLDFPIPDVCPAWGVSPLPARDRSPVRSGLPTLFISGTLDGRTPPDNAEVVRKGFRESRHVLIEGAGHGDDLFVSSPDIEKLMVEYMRTGRVVKSRIVLPQLRFR
jgi:pimeloyl-ACP methyl ester carboxylesterase